MRQFPGTIGLLAGATLLWGCAVEAPSTIDVEDTSVEDDALAAENALNANALNANALNANALNANALNANALNANALTSGALTAIAAPGAGGTLSRQLLKYVVSCALNSSQSFTFSWTDSGNVVHNETYPGLLGIEPGWATAPLSASGERMISACLISRVNYYGVPVIISARSANAPLKTLAGSSELQAYPHVEGAFWGNLFSTTPYAYACYDEKNAAIAHADKRDCATGHHNADGTVSSCGIIKSLGKCKNVCSKLEGAGQYYQSCVDKLGVPKSTTEYVITTALP